MRRPPFATRLDASAPLVRLAAACALAVGAALPLSVHAALAQDASDAPAAEQAEVAPLMEALGMGELLPIMREEGLDYAADLAEDMFPGRGGARWDDIASTIYDTERMRAEMDAEVAARLDASDLEALVPFFESALGRKIVALELSARRALIDPSVEEAAEDAFAEMEAQDDPRLAQLEAFVEANDLVEMNVVGALNSNWAFYQGLDAGGAFDGQMSEEQMLADVWGQEAEIREDTRTWVYSYLGLAYRPLSDDELARYTDLSKTPQGTALNSALFAAFDLMFARISRELGLNAATFMAGEDI